MNIPPPLKKLLIKNLTKDDMLDPLPALNLKNKSTPFKPPHSPWCPRQGSQASFVSYKTCPFPKTTQLHNPSATCWIPMPSHAHGEYSPPSAHSSTPSPRISRGLLRYHQSILNHPAGTRPMAWNGCLTCWVRQIWNQ